MAVEQREVDSSFLSFLLGAFAKKEKKSFATHFWKTFTHAECEGSEAEESGVAESLREEDRNGFEKSCLFKEIFLKS